MKYALLVVLVVELIWGLWGHTINAMHASYRIEDWHYFLAMFPFAAVIDYIAIHYLLSGKYTTATFRYVKILIALFAASALSHLAGAYGFYSDSAAVLVAYDMIGVGILIAEIGVFTQYGMGLFTRRGYNRSSDS